MTLLKPNTHAMTTRKARHGALKHLRSWIATSAIAVIYALIAATIAANAAPRIVSWTKQPDGLVLRQSSGLLRLQVWTPTVIRVTYVPDNALPKDDSLTVIAKPHWVPWTVTSNAATVTLATSQLKTEVDRRTGAVRFLNLKGAPSLSEQPDGRILTPVTLPGPTPEAAYQSQQKFVMDADEAYYGLGQHQQGVMDYRGNVVTLEQQNREVAIPFLVSSRGYGILWDNPAGTKVNVGGSDTTPIPSAQLLNENGTPGGLTARYYDGINFDTLVTTRTDKQIDFDWSNTPPDGLPHDHYSVRWTGFVQANQGGDYSFVTDTDDGGRLWIDGQQVVDDWASRPVAEHRVTVHFAPNSRHAIKMEYYQNTNAAVAHLSWQPPVAGNVLSWSSEAAKRIDYYFFYGPSLDHVIASYRGLTGHAPMPGKWALGLWQSKERYNTQQEWLDIAQGYRSRHEPLDNLVQDWYYWDPHPWGSHEFDANRYPDPAAGIAALHDQYHLHFMISVWGRFESDKPNDPDANADALDAQGSLYPASLSGGARFYDAFSADARALYWRQMRDELFTKGVDAWWLDASEPELDMQGLRRIETGRGLGAFVLNAWPLMHTTGVYQGQRAADPDKRVFILTRSAYAGQQRNGAATWSGDITAGWDVFANQIPAGLNFSLSGIPYWTTDCGAFFVPHDKFPGGSSNPAYAELFTRWFQFAAFCPIFRIHGTDTARELWRFGPDTETVLSNYDRLRYRLMPYLYVQSWQVTHNDATIMRALAFDFPRDRTARELSDEYLFGPAFLVCPVTKPGAVTRSVYLPKGASWTDFWTGSTYSGGATVAAPATIDRMPLYVRAGSIVPMGPDLQYASEKPADPIELRVYPGANGTFTLYEDENDTYHYERGIYATIPMAWNNTTQTLTIGARHGTFPRMLKTRTFHVVWVRPGHGMGIAPTETADIMVHYTGQRLVVKE